MSAEEVKLRRVIGLRDAILIIFGVIIGSGIFVTPTGLLYQLKSVSTTLIVWALCGIISIIGAFCFVELSYLVPRAGSGYAYLQEAFGKTYRLGNMISFLSSWISTLAITPGCITVISLASSEYLCKAIFGRCQVSNTLMNLISALLIISCMIINCYSVEWSSKINNLFSIGKIASLIVITGFGIYYLIIGKVDNLAPDFNKTESNPVNWVSAFYFGLYSYDGWSALNNIVEEIKKPKRNLPLAIIISLILITILYIMVNISYLTLLTPEQMLSSNAVALTWAEIAFGKYYSVLILIAVFIANYGSCLSIMLSSTRITFAAARDSNLPMLLAMIHIKYMTPSPSVILTGLISLLMLISSDIYGLLDFFSFFIWFFYGLNMVALLVIRRQNKNTKTTNKSNKNYSKESRFQVPTILPLFMIAFCFTLMIISLLKPNIGHLIALVITLSGLVYYFPFVYFKIESKFFFKLSLYLQLFLNVKPETISSTQTYL